MFLESFRHLIEIEALKEQNLKNSLQIASENKRIYDLEERRKKLQAQSENLKLDEKNLKLTESQNQIDDLQIRLNKLSSQLSLSVTEKEQIAFENQIKITKEEIEKLENHYFEKLEESENILNQIIENNEFIKGSLATLEEIKKEVMANILIEENHMKNRDVRINSLLDLCHPGFRSYYSELDKKFRPKSTPVSYLISKNCSACHMSVDSALKSSIDEGRSFEACPNCSRLLIPETAKIY